MKTFRVPPPHLLPRGLAMWLPALLLAVPLGASADDPPPELDAPVPRVAASDRDALHKLVGQRAIVFGRIDRTRDWDGGINFLNFEGAAFTAVCFRRNYDQFEDGRPADLYRDKWVELIGIVELYKGKPQIELVRPSQMLRVEDEPPDEKTKPAKPAAPDGDDPTSEDDDDKQDADDTEPAPAEPREPEPAGEGDAGDRVDPDDFFKD